jgi:hypothetical protein
MRNSSIEFRRGARYEQLSLLGAHFVQITAHAVAGADRFARNRAQNVDFGVAAEIRYTLPRSTR